MPQVRRECVDPKLTVHTYLVCPGPNWDLFFGRIVISSPLSKWHTFPSPLRVEGLYFLTRYVELYLLPICINYNLIISTFHLLLLVCTLTFSIPPPPQITSANILSPPQRESVFHNILNILLMPQTPKIVRLDGYYVHDQV
jgi:hypothetical protein